MNHQKNVQRTWRRGSGLMVWTYNLCVPRAIILRLMSPLDRRLWIFQRIERLLKALDDFAAVEDMTIDTRSRGEETFAIKDWQQERFLNRVLRRQLVTRQPLSLEVPQILRDPLDDAVNDAVNIDFTLNLQCLTLDERGIPEEIAIKSGGNLYIFIELDDDGELDTTTANPIWFTLGLDVDIYAPLSWGEQRDNTQLAQLNGPRLSAFLHRLEEDIPAEFLGVDAPDYPGIVDRYGCLLVSQRSPVNQ